QVARAAPDGYTILLAGNFTHAINPWLYRNLSWDPHRDFTPITEVAVMNIIVCVTPERGIRSMKELIAKVRSEPGKWFYASPGNGTSQHLAGEELNRLAGTDMQHVPFKGGAPSLHAVLAGDLPVMLRATPAGPPLRTRPSSRLRARRRIEPAKARGAAMQLKKLGRDFALEASGVDLAQPLSDAAFGEIEKAFFAGQVLVFRGQKLTAREFLG